jgi:hypothetical protein
MIAKLQENDICPKCSAVIGKEGICWKCQMEKGC